MPYDSWKAGERVRITSRDVEGYVATTGDDAVVVLQTDEADVHAVWVYLRETTEFTLVPIDGLQRVDVTG